MGDQYDEMTGPALSEELARRELPVSGRVEELRARLREDDEKRAQSNTDGPDETGGAPDTEDDESNGVDVPEPREPVDYSPMAVVLNEDQARVLNAASAALRRHFRYVMSMSERKYCAGDKVFGVADWANGVCSVLPFGVEIELEQEDEQDGLEKLRAANDELSGG